MALPKIIFSLSLAGVLLICPQAFAQAGSSYEVLTSLRARMNALIAENQRLAQEHQAAQKKFQALQSQVAALEDQIRGIKGDEPIASSISTDNPQSQSTLEKDIHLLENEYLIKQSRAAFLRGEILDFQQKEKLRQLRLAELEYTRRGMAIELNFQQFLSEESQRKQMKETEKLKKLIKFNEEKSKSIIPLMAELEEKRQQYPQEAKVIEQQIAELEKQVKRASSQKEFKERENAILKDQQLLAEKKAQYEAANQQAEKDGLEKEVHQLEIKFNTMDKAMEGALTRQQQRQEMINLITNVDQQNQRLRSKIAGLDQEIKLHQ
jgi:chromosome segregation ATPase